MKPEQRVILEQQNEIRRLRRENRHLRHYVNSTVEPGHHRTPEEALLSSLTQQAQLLDVSSYPRYLYSTLRQSSPFRIWSRLMTHFRRFRFLSAILRTATQIIAFIETSAILLVASTIFIITLPVLLISLLGASIAVLIRGRSLDRFFASELEGRQVFVFFPSQSPAPGWGSVMHTTVEQLARDSDCVVFVVSPYNVSSRVFGQKHRFFMVHQEHKNVFYIRRYYYFRLYRTVLDGLCGQVSVII